MPPERNLWIYDLIYCGQCGSHVPVFRDLAPPEQALVESWKTETPHTKVIAEKTGLNRSDAKSWILHRNGPVSRKGTWNSTPCPHCSRWLRTPEAKQCFHCGTEWH